MDFECYLIECDRSERFDRFLEIAERDDLSDEEYWRLLGKVWTDSEFPSDAEEEWGELFDGQCGSKTRAFRPELMMSERSHVRPEYVAFAVYVYPAEAHPASNP